MCAATNPGRSDSHQQAAGESAGPGGQQGASDTPGSEVCGLSSKTTLAALSTLESLLNSTVAGISHSYSALWSAAF